MKRPHALLTNGVRARPAARALGLKSVASLIEAIERLGVRIRLGGESDLSTAEGNSTRIDVMEFLPGQYDPGE